MITIYHLGVSQSDRVVWLMEELGLPYQLEWYDRLPSKFAPPEYKALHPVATAPTIRDGEKVFCESVAILQYLVNVHGGGRLGVDPDAPNYADYLYWMSFSISLFSTVTLSLVADPASTNPMQALYGKSARDRLERYFGHLNSRLGEADYLAGAEFTAVDIQNVSNLMLIPRMGGPSVEHLPNVVNYIARVQQRPAYKKAMAIAGPDATRPE